VAGHVAKALLDFDDLASLSDNPLCELPDVEEGASNSRALFAEGVTLQAVLKSAVADVIDRLPPGDPRMERIRATLQGVLQSRSIAQIARQHGRSREYWSRSYWKRAVNLVARELVDRTLTVNKP